MAKWAELELEFGTAAAVCARSGLPRYALFAAITDELARRGVIMAHRTNPAHRDLVRHIRADLGLAQGHARRLTALVRNLYDRRLDADYNGPYAVDDRTARESLRDMAEARRLLRRLG